MDESARNEAADAALEQIVGIASVAIRLVAIPVSLFMMLLGSFGAFVVDGPAQQALSAILVTGYFITFVLVLASLGRPPMRAVATVAAALALLVCFWG